MYYFETQKVSFNAFFKGNLWQASCTIYITAVSHSLIFKQVNYMVNTKHPLENISNLITFQIMDKVYCADMQNILRIIDPTELNLKMNQNFSDSYIHIGDAELPLVNPSKILGCDQNRVYMGDQRILAIEIDNSIFCLWVDKILNIYSLDFCNKDEFNFYQNEDKTYLQGMLKFKKEEMQLINLNGLFFAGTGIIN